MAAIGRSGSTSVGSVPWSLLFALFVLLTVEVQSGASASMPFEYFFHQTMKADGVKRSNVSAAINEGNSRVRNEAFDRSLVSQVEDANARRIQTLYQLLEHRPEAQSCYNGRSDRTFRFYCPTPSPDDMENWQCITIDDLCNNIPDCPGAEDEDLVHCMFYMAVQHQTQILRQIIVRHYEQVHTVPNTVRT